MHSKDIDKRHDVQLQHKDMQSGNYNPMGREEPRTKCSGWYVQLSAEQRTRRETSEFEEPSVAYLLINCKKDGQHSWVPSNNAMKNQNTFKMKYALVIVILKLTCDSTEKKKDKK